MGWGYEERHRRGADPQCPLLGWAVPLPPALHSPQPPCLRCLPYGRPPCLRASVDSKKVSCSSQRRSQAAHRKLDSKPVQQQPGRGEQVGGGAGAPALPECRAPALPPTSAFESRRAWRSPASCTRRQGSSRHMHVYTQTCTCILMCTPSCAHTRIWPCTATALHTHSHVYTATPPHTPMQAQPHTQPLPQPCTHTTTCPSVPRPAARCPHLWPGRHGWRGACAAHGCACSGTWRARQWR